MRKMIDARDRIRDNEVLKSYDKYKSYLTELSIYEKSINENKSNKINIFKLARLYKDNGINTKGKKELEARFYKFSSVINKAKQDDPDLDLKDISTQKGRKSISDIISKVQDDEKIKPADLDPVSVIENFALYIAVKKVDEGKLSKEGALIKLDIESEKFDRAQSSYRKYQKTGIVNTFNNLCKKKNGEIPNELVHYTAGSLELTPSEAQNDLNMIQVLRGNYTKKNEEDKTFVVYKVSQLIIDNIMRDPGLTPEEKNQKICELELAEYERVSKNVEEANFKQNTDRYKIVSEDDNRGIV